MRTLTAHIVNPANDKITITVVDQPGPGGANHEYHLKYGGSRIPLIFQNGAINEVGVNGITHEALLAVLADRLEGFQAGPYACEENADALRAINVAQEILQSRTRRRMAANIEGTMALDTDAYAKVPEGVDPVVHADAVDAAANGTTIGEDGNYIKVGDDELPVDPAGEFNATTETTAAWQENAAPASEANASSVDAAAEQDNGA